MPPCTSFEVRLLVPDARSPASTRRTRSPRSVASRATATPWMPPPITRRREDRLEEVAEEIRREHRVEVATLAFVVRDRAATERALSQAHGLLAKVDLLVNNAGLALALESVQAGDPADWDQMIDTNVKGLLYVTRAVLP